MTYPNVCIHCKRYDIIQGDVKVKGSVCVQGKITATKPSCYRVKPKNC